MQISQEKVINSGKFENFKNSLQLKEAQLGLYQCAARISQKNSIPYENRNLIILNRHHLLTKLIVEDCNHRIKYNAERHNLSEVRKKY